MNTYKPDQVLYTKTGITCRNIYTPIPSRPMHIAVFASGSGGNLKAAIGVSQESPNLLQVGLVVTDRPGILAIEIAKNYGIPVIVSDFEKECGIWEVCRKDPVKARKYQQTAIGIHNHILQQIITLEKKLKSPFDLVVLSYHRWIHGDLFRYFNERMINQHAGDATTMQTPDFTTRRFIGINPVYDALKAGERKTRTSTFVVRESHDGGEILCQGPWVIYTGPLPITKESAREHEYLQKQQSDWPSLRFALREIAQGHFGLAVNNFHRDGCKIVIYKGKFLPYGGVDLSMI